MGIITTTTFAVLLFLFAGLTAGAVQPIYDVVKFGAVGDGRSDDSQHFLRAWSTACNDTGSPKLVIPSGKTFLLRRITFSGPCKSSINVQVLGNIVAPNHAWKLQQMDNWITFIHINNLTVDGGGQFDGRGSVWWKCKDNGKCPIVPDAFAVLDCNNLTLSGLRFRNAPSKHVTVYGSVGVLINGLDIKAPEHSKNTDGMHIQECQKVQILDSDIASGDDCIAIGAGTSDVSITHINCGPGHGISIGSLGGGKIREEVRDINISYCNFFTTVNGARIKTWPGGSGFAKGISFQHINVTSVQFPVIIDQYYCPEQNCKNYTSAVQVSDIRFVGIHGTSAGDDAVRLACSESVACTGIVLEDINITFAVRGRNVSSYCLNAHGNAHGVVSPQVPCLS